MSRRPAPGAQVQAPGGQAGQAPGGLGEGREGRVGSVPSPTLRFNPRCRLAPAPSSLHSSSLHFTNSVLSHLRLIHLPTSTTTPTAHALPVHASPSFPPPTPTPPPRPHHCPQLPVKRRQQCPTYASPALALPLDLPTHADTPRPSSFASTDSSSSVVVVRYQAANGSRAGWKRRVSSAEHTRAQSRLAEAG